jgi:hypothetical protein
MSLPTQAMNSLPSLACVNVMSRISQDNWIYFTYETNKLMIPSPTHPHPPAPKGRTRWFWKTLLLLQVTEDLCYCCSYKSDSASNLGANNFTLQQQEDFIGLEHHVSSPPTNNKIS